MILQRIRSVFYLGLRALWISQASLGLAQNAESLSVSAGPIPTVLERGVLSNSGGVAIDGRRALLGNRFVVFEGKQWNDAGMLPTDLQWSVALEGDWAIAAAPIDYRGDIFRGHAEAFRYTEGSWTKVQDIVAGDGDNWDEFGSAAEMDDGTVVISAKKDENGEGNPNLFSAPTRGSVYIFELEDDRWVKKQKLTSPLGQSQFFGHDVAIRVRKRIDAR